MAFTLGYGGWMIFRYGNDTNFALNGFDVAYAAAFIVLMFCIAQGFNLLPSVVLALIVSGATAGVRIFFRKRRIFSYPLKCALVMTSVWVLALELWGFVWGWDHYFHGDQFAVLHIAVPLICAAAFAAYRYLNKG